MSMGCPYCSSAQDARSSTTPSGRSVTECCSCGRIVEEKQIQPHDLFLLRAQDSPLSLVTPDLPPLTSHATTNGHDEDPFQPTGFITAFSTWSLEPTPIVARSSLSFSGYLAELERVLATNSSSNSSSSSSVGPVVSVDNLRAYLQIIDVASILGLDRDISDHAFQLFRDCSSATCLRNRNVEALATAAVLQTIREAQEPRTLQEISTAANLPQKEIGKYIKILGEALKLSQPINSNSISVHMPRFCSLLQLNKSARDLATHIGEVVINKCFCTRRNPISISAAAIYLACLLEDKRKTQAEICKVTGLTEVTLRKVYKELLENWDDLLPPSYTPAVPPEKAFPTTTITSGRSSTPKVESVEISSPQSAQQEKDKQPEPIKQNKTPEVWETDKQATGKGEIENKYNSHGPPLSSCGGVDIDPQIFNPYLQLLYGMPAFREGEKNQKSSKGININQTYSNNSDFVQVDRDPRCSSGTQKAAQLTGSSDSNDKGPWLFHASQASRASNVQFLQPQTVSSFAAGLHSVGNSKRGDKPKSRPDTDKK